MFKIPIPENITFFFDPRTYVPFLDLTDLSQDIICRVLLLHKAQHIDTSVCLRVSIAIIKTWISGLRVIMLTLKKSASVEEAISTFSLREPSSF